LAAQLNAQLGDLGQVRVAEEAAHDCTQFLQSAQGVGGFGSEFVLAGDADLADAVVFDVLPRPFVTSSGPDSFSGSIGRQRLRKGCRELRDQSLGATACALRTESVNLPRGHGLSGLNANTQMGDQNWLTR